MSRIAPIEAGQITPDTRERLIEAAGEVFAERGFRDATVREICTKAGANIAAINYHFRDKSGLYLVVLKSAHERAERAFPFVFDGKPVEEAPARDQLRAFVVITLQRLMDPGKPTWHWRLMVREMVDPTPALDELVAQSIRPKRDLIVSIVRGVVGESVPQDVVEACARSVIGQIFFHKNNRAVIERLFPNVSFDEVGQRAIGEHIARFSLAALDQIAGEYTQGGPL